MTAAPTTCEHNIIPKLETQLTRLSKAPLKPQQRMYFLRAHVIPGMYHRLVLDKITSGLLRHIDITIRKAILKWLHLPKDTTNSYIHSDNKDGGLGIPSLKFQIPILRKTRLENLIVRAASGSDPLLQTLLDESPYMKAELKRWGQGLKVKDRTFGSKRQVKKWFSDCLYASVDGSGLVHHQQSQGISGWVVNGTGLLTGRSYVHANQIRSATLHTAYRAARGFPNASTACDSCGRPETLSHILQTCERTGAPRDDRHDRVNALAAKYLEEAQWSVVLEPTIPTPAGIRRPDIVAFKFGSEAFVLDTSIVGDNFCPDLAYDRKCEYYNSNEIRSYVAQLSGCEPDSVNMGAVIFNWRGAQARKTASLFTHMGVSRSKQEVLSVRALEGGYRIWSCFKDSTWVARGRLPGGRRALR